MGLVWEKLCPSTKVWIDYEFEKPYAPVRLLSSSVKSSEQ